MFPTSIFYAIEKIDHEQKRRQNVGVADCALAEEIGKLWSRRVTLAQDSPTSGHPMNQAVTQLFLFVLLWLLPAVSLGQETQSSASKVRLGPTTKLDLINADIKWVKYHGRHALHVVPLTGHEHAVEEDMLAVLSESDFKIVSRNSCMRHADRPRSAPDHLVSDGHFALWRRTPRFTIHCSALTLAAFGS